MKHRFIRGAVGLAGASLVAGVVTTLPVSAKSNMITSCGQVITTIGHWVLANDLSCPASTATASEVLTAGIVIRKGGVTVDLNGHNITGMDTTNSTGNEQIGVLFANVKGAKLMDSAATPGSISGFDAGVAILGGGGDTVSGLSVHDNIAHVLLTGGVAGTKDPSGNPCTSPNYTGEPTSTAPAAGQCWAAGYGDPSSNPCNYGDGIIADNSNGDTIIGNTATHNGPFSGIALVDSSSDNNVDSNTTDNQTVSNILVSSTPGGSLTPPLSGPCGPFGANIVGRGRAHQDIGLRIEGPGASYNTVSNNTSDYNQLEGISVHSHVCDTSPSYNGPPPAASNEFNLIENNTVSGNGNGITQVTDHGQGNGISLLQEGPTGIVCPGDNETITGNTVSYNQYDGVFLPGRNSNFNTVSNNTITNNGHDGVELTGGASAGPSSSHPTFPITVFNGANNDTVSGNTIQNNANDGVELDAGSRTVFNGQSAATIAPGASNNTITGNSISGSGSDGIELHTLTATIAPATTPSVVAGAGADSNAVSSNTITGSGHDGIQADGPMLISQNSPDGASGNTFNGNSASGSPTFDAEDDNTNCDSNSWGATTADSFGTKNQTCIS